MTNHQNHGAQVEKNAAQVADTARIIRAQLDSIANLANVNPDGASLRIATHVLVASDLLDAAREHLAQALSESREAARWLRDNVPSPALADWLAAEYAAAKAARLQELRARPATGLAWPNPDDPSPGQIDAEYAAAKAARLQELRARPATGPDYDTRGQEGHDDREPDDYSGLDQSGHPQARSHRQG